MTTANWNDLPHCQTPAISHQIANVEESLWMSTNYDHGEKGMVEYNTKTNKIIQIVQYPKSIKPLFHSVCQHENNIYIVNGYNSQIILFNPFTKQFIIKNKLPKLGIGTCCIEMNNYIHIFNGHSNTKHIIYSIKHNTIQILNDLNATQNIGAVNTFHYNERIIRFGGMNCNTYRSINSFMISTQIKNNNFANIQWTDNINYKLPFDVSRCGFVLYKHYIILFGGHTNGFKYSDSIYLLQLNDINNGWIKLNHIKCPLKSEYFAVFDSNQKYIHLFTGDNKKDWKQSILKHYSIPFSQILNNIETENKNIEFECSECAILREQINVIKSENNSLKTYIQNYMQKEIETFKNDKNQIDELKQNEIKLVQKYEEKLDILQNNNNNLNEECKELKLELNEIKKRINKNIVLKNYKNWNFNEFIDWIICLENGRYKKYENTLRIIFKEEDVDGYVIHTIGKSEWKDWGINNYKDRVNLDRHIKNLINKNQQNINYNENEVDATPYI